MTSINRSRRAADASKRQGHWQKWERTRTSNRKGSKSRLKKKIKAMCGKEQQVLKSALMVLW